ncbi:MAG: hypothetical protein QMD14_01085 [Candidatus Aenigmarchaeota archaeon]|nr:hypothetical protein [Candidatus Aenigmarchaeota archaeon]
MVSILFITNFLILTGVIGGFITVIILTIASRKFLKGDVRSFAELLLCGCMFLYSFLVTQSLIDIFMLSEGFFQILKGIFLYIATLYFIFAGIRIYTISKVLGFASEKISKKLKRILEI